MIIEIIFEGTLCISLCFRLVEVNGVNIAGENHKQVVARIKSMMMETILLVSDTNSDNYHKERGIIIKNSLPYVIKLSNCSDDDITNNGDNHDENNAVTDYIDDDDEIIDTRLQKVSFKNTESKIVKPTRSVKIVTDNDRDIVNKSEVNRDCSRQDSGVCEEEVDAITKAVTNNNNNNETDITELGLNLSVEEVKERIRRRRKHDPRTIPVKRASGDWWNQYKMIQTL